MNGSPRTRSPRLSRTKPWKYRIHCTRALESQKFDNAFYGIPLDLKDDVIKYRILQEIKLKRHYNSVDAEKIAKKLFKNNNLDLYNSVVTNELADNLIKQVKQENFLITVFEVPSSGEDSPCSIEVESSFQRLDRENEKKQNEAKRLLSKRSRSNSAAGSEDTEHLAKHWVDILESPNQNLEIEKAQEKENKARKVYKNSEHSVKTDKNNNLVRGEHFTDILEGTFVTSSSIDKHQEKEKSQSPFTLKCFASLDNPKKASPAKNYSSKSSSYKNLKRRRIEMMSDYPKEQNYHHPVTNGEPYGNVATLFNMGNTCFLNSVLYTLRFAPTFLHNLHHLLVDLTLINTKLKENKTKTSSLGRNGSAVSGNSWRSASSKDLLSIGNDIIPKTKDQIVTEKLHALFVTMNNLETKDSPDSYQPEALLQAIRDANPIFEGNHQQDAHEFFVELLSCLRVTCDKLNEQIEQYPELIKAPEATTTNNSKIWGVRRSWKKPLKKKDKLGSKKNKHLENEESATESDTDNLSTDECADSNKKKFGYNFIAEDFQGVSLHRTKCLECEEVSELKEPFLEIQVPVNSRDDDVVHDGIDSSIFGSVCVTSEKLCDQNKYFCENCNKYNEALRTVLYEKLPNIMVLHLKRFTTSSSGVQKVTTFVPTPLEIRCFCETCNKSEKSKTTPHRYRLSCVIMHLGASMASGHYIAYSRASIQPGDYIDCTRDIPKNYLNSSGREISANFLKLFKTKTLGNSLSENQNGLGPHLKKNDTQVCQSINCCGVRSKLNLGSLSGDWLEFDDEKVKTLSTKEFVDILNRRQESTNTPYLLFYSKVQQ